MFLLSIVKLDIWRQRRAKANHNKQTHLLIIMAVITGSHPEWRTVLVAGCLAAMTIPIGVRAKKKAPTKGDI